MLVVVYEVLLVVCAKYTHLRLHGMMSQLWYIVCIIYIAYTLLQYQLTKINNALVSIIYLL